MSLAADWALFGKHPGDTKDYHVLQASRGPLPLVDYEPLIRRYLPGTPTAEAGDRNREDALPWVWFGPAGDQPEPWLGVGMMRLGDSMDQVGRRTDPTTFLRLRWSELALGRPSFAGLAQAVGELALPRGDGGQGAISPPGVDPERLAHLVDNELGFEWTAVVAASLLESPVTLLHPGALDLDRRLAMLDGIAALLPYGLRADLAASTWAGPARPIRLSFAGQAGAGQRPAIPGRDVPDPDPDGLAGRYLRLLRRTRARRGTVAVVRYLADQVAPQRFDDPAAVVELLRELDRPWAAWEDVEAGTGDLAEVRLVFDGGRVRELPAGERTDLAGFLLARGDADDVDRVERVERTGPVSTAELAGHRFAAAYGALLEDDQALLQAHLRRAQRADRLDDVLAELLMPQQAIGRYEVEAASRGSGALRALAGRLAGQRSADPARAEAAQRRAVQLLCTGFEQEPRVPGNWPAVRRVLEEQPGLVYEVLAPSMGAGALAEAGALVAWVAADQPVEPALRPLLAVSRSEPVDGSDLLTVRSLGPDRFLALIELAGTAGQADQAARWVWDWLPDKLAGLTDGARHRWRDALDRLLSQPTVGPRIAARRDLLFIALDGWRWPKLRSELLSDQADQYAEQFAHTLADDRLDGVRVAVIQGLGQYLAEYVWKEPHTAVANSALVLLRQAFEATGGRPSDARKAREALLRVVLDGIEQEQAVMELPEYRQTWEQIMAQSPDHRHRAATAGLRRLLRSGAAPETAAAAAAPLLAAGELREGLESLVRDLRQSEYLRDGRSAVEFVDTLDDELTRAHLSARRCREIRLGLFALMLSGELGTRLASSLKVSLVDQISSQLRELSELVPLVLEHLPEANQKVLYQEIERFEERTRRPGKLSRLWPKSGRQ